ncbi:unnamed protein product [Brassica rapa subsp. narinosa]
MRLFGLVTDTSVLVNVRCSGVVSQAVKAVRSFSMCLHTLQGLFGYLGLGLNGPLNLS